jgi:ATP-binding cassette subfamily B protein
MPKKSATQGTLSPSPDRSWADRLRSLENVVPLVKMAWETNPWLASISLITRLVRSVVPICAMYVGKLIIDAVVRQGVWDHSRVWRLLVIEVALAVISDLLGRVAGLADNLLGERFTSNLSIKLMRHAATLDLSRFEEPAFQDMLERAREQTGGRMQLITQTMKMAQELITVMTLTSALVVFSPALILLLVCSVIPAFIGESHFASLSYALMHRRMPQRRELEYLRWLGAAQETAKEIKILGLGEYLIDRYRRLADLFYLENSDLLIRRAKTGFLLTLLGTAGYYSAYVVIVYRTMHGALTIGDLTFLAGSFGRSRGLIESILATFAIIGDRAVFLDDLFAFFRLKPLICSGPLALPAPRPMRRGLEFRNVSFDYPGSVRPALSNVSFEVRPGERVALVGENGAGKTTITKLIARMYDPTDGLILIDGVDLREYDVEDWRKEIGIIFQDYVRYQLLLWENIGFGRVECLDDRERIERAAEFSGAAEVAARLENGLHQMLGRRFSGGVDLSGGEWQKVALSRAYMRDAQLLILDEPTATLDARSESKVFERFAELTQDKMALLISHRFSTVRAADRILVIDNGSICEDGTHDDLVRLNGLYAELFELQAAGYRQHTAGSSRR